MGACKGSKKASGEFKAADKARVLAVLPQHPPSLHPLVGLWALSWKHPFIHLRHSQPDQLGDTSILTLCSLRSLAQYSFGCAHLATPASRVTGVFLLEATSALEAMLWLANRHASGRLPHPPSIRCRGMIHLHSPNSPKMPCAEQTRLCPSPKSEKQMVSRISEAHEAEPGLKSASFWPESEPGSLVFSYFCLAWSISQMKDIQSPDNLQQWAFWILKTVISPMACCCNFCWV